MIEDLDSVETVAPCRVLMKDGKPVDYVVTKRPVRPDPFRPTAAPKSDTPYSYNGNHARPVKPKKTSRKGGRGWARNNEATAERISAMQSEGMSIKEIAAKLKCCDSLIYSRLRLRDRGKD